MPGQEGPVHGDMQVRTLQHGHCARGRPTGMAGTKPVGDISRNACPDNNPGDGNHLVAYRTRRRTAGKATSVPREANPIRCEYGDS